MSTCKGWSLLADLKVEMHQVEASVAILMCRSCVDWILLGSFGLMGFPAFLEL